jgi:hypothetical protein
MYSLAQLMLLTHPQSGLLAPAGAPFTRRARDRLQPLQAGL